MTVGTVAPVSRNARRQAASNLRRDMAFARKHHRTVARGFQREGLEVAAAVSGTLTVDQAISAAVLEIDREIWLDVLSVIWSDVWADVYPETTARVAAFKDAGWLDLKGRRLETLVELITRLENGDGRTARAVGRIITNHADEIVASSERQIRRVLTRGETFGRSAATAVRRTWRDFSGSRAARIALNESFQAAAYAQNDAALVASQRLAVPVLHQWITVGDAYVRRSHAETHGMVRPLEQPFRVGGALLRFPRDPGGPAAETINCRCSEVYLRGR